jgi:hypothetical protein
MYTLETIIGQEATTLAAAAPTRPAPPATP